MPWRRRRCRGCRHTVADRQVCGRRPGGYVPAAVPAAQKAERRRFAPPAFCICLLICALVELTSDGQSSRWAKRQLRKGPPHPGGMAHPSGRHPVFTKGRGTSMCHLGHTARVRRPSGAWRSRLRSEAGRGGRGELRSQRDDGASVAAQRAGRRTARIRMAGVVDSRVFRDSLQLTARQERLARRLGRPNGQKNAVEGNGMIEAMAATCWRTPFCRYGGRAAQGCAAVAS